MGGIVVTWTDGAPFRAGFIRNSSTEARIAYQNGIRELFTIVFSDMLELLPNDRVKRISDGKSLSHHVRRAGHDNAGAERYALPGGGRGGGDGVIDLQRKLYKFWNSFTYEGKAHSCVC